MLRILTRISHRPPFTTQRLCELLLEPRRWCKNSAVFEQSVLRCISSIRIQSDDWCRSVVDDAADVSLQETDVGALHEEDEQLLQEVLQDLQFTEDSILDESVSMTALEQSDDDLTVDVTSRKRKVSTQSDSEPMADTPEVKRRRSSSDLLAMSSDELLRHALAASTQQPSSPVQRSAVKDADISIAASAGGSISRSPASSISLASPLSSPGISFNSGGLTDIPSANLPPAATAQAKPKLPLDKLFGLGASLLSMDDDDDDD